MNKSSRGTLNPVKQFKIKLITDADETTWLEITKDQYIRIVQILTEVKRTNQ